MARVLSSDASTREGLVAYAEAYARQPYDTALARASSERLDQVVGRLEGMSLPLGWPADTVATNWVQRGWNRARSLEAGAVLGLLLTTFAVSLGAPFWFDLLKNLLKLRSLLAKQDEEERKKRQEATAQEGTKKPKDAQSDALVPIQAAEVGDLRATGANG